MTALVLSVFTAGCHRPAATPEPLPAAPPPVAAPTLSPLPTGRSELRDGGLWMDAALTIALDVWTWECEQLPGLAELSLAEQRRIDDARLRLVVEQAEAHLDTEVARAISEATGIPVWSVLLWVGAALVVGGAGGLVLGLVAR